MSQENTIDKTLFGRVSVAAGNSTLLNNSNKIYNSNELIVELNTGKMKLGNEIDYYKDLPYIVNKSLTEDELQYVLNIIKSGIVTDSGEFNIDVLPDTILYEIDKIYLDSGDGSWSKEAYESFLESKTEWNKKYGYDEEVALHELENDGYILYTRELPLVTPSGRKIWRHENDLGSVIQFDMFGTTMEVFVLDAKYRYTGEWGAQEDASTPNFDDEQITENSVTYLFSENGVEIDVSNYTELPALNDRDLQMILAVLANDKTAKENSDVWYTYKDIKTGTGLNTSTGAPVIEHAREQFADIFDDGLDIPNLYETAVLLIEGNYFDQLDKTVKDYPTAALGKYGETHRRFLNGKTYSSTEVNADYMLGIYNTGLIKKISKYTGDDNNAFFFIVPVKEL